MRTKNLVVSRLEVIHDINDHFRNFKRNFENIICVELPTPLKICAAAEKYLDGRDGVEVQPEEGFGSLLKMGAWQHFCN